MPLVSFAEMMAEAARRRCAVGYFESWNLESLLAVADAARTCRAPVILGFSGIYLPHPERRVEDPLTVYAAMARAVAAELPVPVVLLFNESPHRAWIEQAIALGFGLVMPTPEEPEPRRREEVVAEIVALARAHGAAVEAEMAPIAGLAGDVTELTAGPPLTDPEQAAAFLARTGIDALAVDVGQLHLHGRRTVRLDLPRLRALAELGVPLVLHGGSSIAPDDLRAAVALGVRKINVGSVLKQTFLRAVCAACPGALAANPYEAIGSGLAADVLLAGRLAMQAEVERWLDLLRGAP